MMLPSHLCLIQHFRGRKSQTCISTKLARLKLGKIVNLQNLFKMTVWDLVPGIPQGGMSPEELLPTHNLRDKGNQCRDPSVGLRKT